MAKQAVQHYQGRLAEQIIPSPGQLTLAQAQAIAARARQVYRETMDAQFCGRATSWDTLLARLSWCQAESRCVDLRVQAPKPLEQMSGDDRRGNRRPRHLGKGAA